MDREQEVEWRGTILGPPGVGEAGQQHGYITRCNGERGSLMKFTMQHNRGKLKKSKNEQEMLKNLTPSFFTFLTVFSAMPYLERKMQLWNTLENALKNKM